MSHALRELKQRRRRLQRERHKSNRFRLAKKKKQQNDFVRASRLFVHFYFFISWTLIKSFRIQLQNKSANERLTNKRDGTTAIKFEVKRIHILSDWRFRSRRRRCCFNNNLPHATSKQSNKSWAYNKILILHFSHSQSPFKLSQTYFRSKKKKNTQPKTKILLFWASRGVEPGTSRTLRENHATRPTGHPHHFDQFLFDLIWFIFLLRSMFITKCLLSYIRVPLSGKISFLSFGLVINLSPF